MQFDDRLKTVMMQPVMDLHDRTIRWRQLVDLLSRMPGQQQREDDGLVDAALAIIRGDYSQIPDAARAATARSIAGRPADPRLIAIFARDKLAIAAPLLAASTLDDAGWALVDADASDDVSILLASLGRSESSAPSFVDPPVVSPPPVADGRVIDETPILAEPTAAQTTDNEEELPSIGEMVARIERLRHTRTASEPDDTERDVEPAPDSPLERAEQPAAATDAEPVEEVAVSKAEPPLVEDVISVPPPPDDVQVAQEVEASEPALFRWESDAGGQIAWVDGVPRGPLIGRNLADEEDSGRELVRALNDRAPFDGAVLTLESPSVAGAWRLSAIPAFSPQDGRFLGYRGIARKDTPQPVPEVMASRRPPRVNRDLDALRETIHEIKTPLNAIIGFAEIIDGQYLGPAHRNYRLRAAQIVGQARTLLGAIEDLDYAARVQAEITSQRQSTDLGDVMPQLERDLRQKSDIAGVTLVFDTLPDAKVATSRDLAERLIRRFLAAVLDAGSEGERFNVTIDRQAQGGIRVGVGRPMATVGLSSDELLEPSFVVANNDGANILGLGFALRMVRGLARMVNGDVVVDESGLAIFLPEARS